MKTLHIESVDLVTGGLIVTYDDQTRAFYDESVLMAHLAESGEQPEKKRPRAFSLRAPQERLRA